ncbi:MAG: glycoside hydrolase family 99-like domain-containing protein [Bacteroides acidifaciens]|uniref:glycoside hydrolase family 99-like domain-containing protein n=1 Tax=Bacteroides acidifaciens TaxID=85831 RepID=UPI0023C4E66A|nr:glycoside hydrolase family 99-like domain-containing protein [Bacteroides acidifaciens]MDE6820109.1 glycoside hydrolase family 99-like domain-containing protein [Bacteroides acidifaciens]MDE6986247.1 glycoside hydrolase family 99-like domain-containing protein [Bacteroides acidifaciens]
MNKKLVNRVGKLIVLLLIVGLLPAYAQKKGKEKVNRLPDDLETLAGDPALLEKPEGLTVAAYAFPNYHASALHNKIYSQGWTEYNLIRSARPWFEGHQQPRTPLLGELDESKPSTWETYNKLCKQSGIDVLIWDWYWYDGKPCLHEALENGFLEANNAKDVKFACMWTNHPWYVLYPTKKTDGSNAYPPSYDAPDFSKEECWKSLSYMISRYCHLENYWRIDGKPVICIWDARRLESKLGVAGVKQLFAELTDYAKNLGHKGLHFHVTGFSCGNMKEEGYSTVGSYNPMDWIAGRFQPKEIELPDYGTVAADVAFKLWDEHHGQFDIPYIPAVAPGWDSTPRYIAPASRPEKPNRSQWPACTIFKNENPASFKAFVQSSFVYLNKHPEVPRILTIACFNEWSEGHYLLPDNRFGYGMLDALGEALGKEGNHQKHGK